MVCLKTSPKFSDVSTRVSDGHEPLEPRERCRSVFDGPPRVLHASSSGWLPQKAQDSDAIAAFRASRFCQQPSIMRCATTLIASLSMAAAMRLPAMAVPSSSLAPRMYYDLRGGGKAAASSPFDMIKGRKIVLSVHESYGPRRVSATAWLPQCHR